jgi:hypothetical protein
VHFFFIDVASLSSCFEEESSELQEVRAGEVFLKTMKLSVSVSLEDASSASMEYSWSPLRSSQPWIVLGSSIRAQHNMPFQVKYD